MSGQLGRMIPQHTGAIEPEELDFRGERAVKSTLQCTSSFAG